MKTAQVYGDKIVIKNVEELKLNDKKGAVVKNSIIMADVVIGENSIIEYSIIDENTIVGNNAKVGEPLESKNGIAVLSRGIKVEDGAVIKGGAMIDSDYVKEGK